MPVRILIPAALAAGLLSACEPMAAPPPAAEDACGAGPLQAYVGQSIDAVPQALRAEARVTRPGDVVTMDYRADRLNIRLDDDDIVEEILCG